VKTFAAVLIAVAVVGAAGVFAYRSVGAEGTKGAGKGAKSDRDKLQGTWVLVSVESGGKKEVLDKDKSGTLTVKGDKGTMKMGRGAHDVTFHLDPSKTPKQVDMTVNEGDKDEVHKGIYKLDGDTFTLCKSHPPQQRPTKFASKEGERWPQVFVFKRQAKAKSE
jgi:uncharacterized protein (TIGR03067 family)